MNRVYFVIIALICMFYIISTVKKGKFSANESFFWTLGTFIALFLAVFPYFFDQLAKFVGISYPPSLLFLLCIIFLLFINFRNNKKIAELNEKSIELAQHISIIEANINKNKGK